MSVGRRPWLRFALPLIALTLLIAVVGVLAYRSLSEQVRRETHRTLAVITEQKRQQLEDALAERRLDAELYFSGQSRIETLLERWLAEGRHDPAGLVTVQSALAELASARQLAGLALFDREGRVLAAFGQSDLSRPAQRVREMMRAPRVEFVDLHREPSGRAQYGLLAPMGGAGRSGQAPFGAVYMSWSAERDLYPQVGAWPVPTESAETYLVRREGAGVAFLTPLRFQQQAALAWTLPLDTPDMPAARAARGERGILLGARDYRRVPVLAYVAPVAGTSWLMVAEIDEVEAYAGVRHMAWTTALLMGLGLLFVYSAAYLLWRRERQRAELVALQGQRLAEARFRAVFEQAPLGVALLDVRSGCIVEANARCAQILGREAQDLVGLSLADATHPEDAPASRENLARLARGEAENFSLERRYLHRDGKVVWARLTGAPVQVEHDELRRLLLIFEDITARQQIESERQHYAHELRQAYDAAEAANAAKSEFLAHMSHEIRTPMNAVLGLAQVLAREPLTADQREMVERIGSAGQSLLALLNDVLDLSKIEAGQLRLEPRPFELDALLAKLYSLMGQVARAKGLDMRLHAPQPALGALLGDGLRLEQILINLVGNAVKFTERGSVEVRVRVTEQDERALWLRFEVVDSGMGIAPEALERLFTPFTQADAGIGRRFGGTGLGLSICKRLVELMGGEIGADSQPGRGSCFWFELPFGRSAQICEPVARPRLASPSGPRLAGAQVLVVDDSAMNRDLVERALRLEGAAATPAADGQQALQLLASRPGAFDAVLMDVQMPVLDGLSAIRLIRGELGLRELPVIAFTAGVREDQQAAARAAGADDMLPKPMDLEQMVELLLRWVRPRAVALPPPETAAPTVAMAVASAASVPPDPAGTAFPAIAGIDAAQAARRLGGDREMFIDLLRMFVAEHGDAQTRARDELARGEREAAARRLHTLRSSAGFLCAIELMQAAGALEQAIDRGESGLDERLDALGRQLADLLAASAPWR